MLRVTSHRARRSRLTAMAVVSGTAGAVLVWSPGALAAAGCTTTTPSIGQTIMCNVAGTESITVPDGANAMEVVVIGGGGAGGSRNDSTGDDGADGGQGAFVGAALLLPEDSSTVIIDVAPGGGTNNQGGRGGGFSRIVAGGSLLVVAGGGGGGGFGDPSATGGDGASGEIPGGGVGGGGAKATGGSGGSNGDPGTGGVAADPDGSTGAAGQSYNIGGSGGSGDGGSGGYGGSGYGGGGGGASYSAGAETFQGGGGAGGSYVNDTYLVGSPQFMPSPGTPGDGGRGETSGVSRAAGVAGAVSITFLIRSTPTPVSSTNTAAPATVLVFALPEGVACNFNSVEASIGSWIELPSASDCTITPRDGGEDPSLLGWATQKDFPVEIAQRQVDNGWGAYETYGDDGQLTGVFIPAGGYTVLSNDTNLYPIWS